MAPEWDAQFVSSMENEMLFELILCANYLAMPNLLDLACGKVASMVRNKSTDEIRKEFNIQDNAYLPGWIEHQHPVSVMPLID